MANIPGDKIPNAIQPAQSTNLPDNIMCLQITHTDNIIMRESRTNWKVSVSKNDLL